MRRARGFTAEEVEALRESWADVGVDCGDIVMCDFDGRCDVTAGETCTGCAGDCGPCSDSCSPWQKAKCRNGTGDCSGCGDTAGCGDGLCSDDETDETCGEDCGCAAPGNACGDVA